MVETAALTKNQLISVLTKSVHGKLAEYIPITQQAAKSEPEFLAHLISWNAIKGQVRDAQIALPVISLSVPEFGKNADGTDNELAINSLAQIGDLGPRELLKAYHFMLDVRPTGRIRQMRRLVEAYLKEVELNGSNYAATVLRHRKVLRELYALTHTKASPHSKTIIMQHRAPVDKSVFAVVKRLKSLPAEEAAGLIAKHKIPLLTAWGALEDRVSKEPDLVLALIKSMTPTELVSNMKTLEKWGVRKNDALRGALDVALDTAGSSKRAANTLKTSARLDSSGKCRKHDVVDCQECQLQDESLQNRLRGLQEKQLASMSIEGSWLVLGDRSGSMSQAIQITRHVAATLAKMVKGKVWLTFFNESPMTIDVTGLALDIIQKSTEHIVAGGGTSIGCGLQRIMDVNQAVDGIAIISDGGDNTAPFFHDVYKRYSQQVGKEVPVYLYLCNGSDPNHLKTYMSRAGFDLQEIDLRGGVDYYSLPNVVQTMRTNRYSIIDEVMAVPLLGFNDVFKLARKEVDHIAPVIQKLQSRPA
jgi:hypothetical protein